MPNKTHGFVRHPAAHLAKPGQTLVSDGRETIDLTGYAHPAGRSVLQENASNVCPALQALHKNRPKGAKEILKGRPRVDTKLPAVSSPVPSPTFFKAPAPGLLRIDGESGAVKAADGSGAVPSAHAEAVEKVQRYLEGEGTFSCAVGRMGQFERSHVFSVCEHEIGSPAAVAHMVDVLRQYLPFQSEKFRQGNYRPVLMFVFPNDPAGPKAPAVDEAGVAQPHPREVEALTEAIALHPGLLPARGSETDGFTRDFFVDELHPSADRPGRQCPCTIVSFTALDQFNFYDDTHQLNVLRKSTDRRETSISGSPFAPRSLPTLKVPMPREMMEREMQYIREFAEGLQAGAPDVSVARLQRLRWRYGFSDEDNLTILKALARNCGALLSFHEKELRYNKELLSLRPENRPIDEENESLLDVLYTLKFEFAGRDLDAEWSHIARAFLDELEADSPLAHRVALIAAVAGDHFDEALAVSMLEGQPDPDARPEEDAAPLTRERVSQALARLNRPNADFSKMAPDGDMAELFQSSPELLAFANAPRIDFRDAITRQEALAGADGPLRQAVAAALRPRMRTAGARDRMARTAHVRCRPARALPTSGLA